MPVPYHRISLRFAIGGMFDTLGLLGSGGGNIIFGNGMWLKSGADGGGKSGGKGCFRAFRLAATLSRRRGDEQT